MGYYCLSRYMVLISNEVDRFDNTSVGQKEPLYGIWTPIGTFFVPPMYVIFYMYVDHRHSTALYSTLLAYVQDVEKYFYIVLRLQFCMFQDIGLTYKVRYRLAWLLYAVRFSI